MSSDVTQYPSTSSMLIRSSFRVKTSWYSGLSSRSVNTGKESELGKGVELVERVELVRGVGLDRESEPCKRSGLEMSTYRSSVFNALSSSR